MSGYETEKDISTDIVFSFNAHETENITVTGYDYLINYTLSSTDNEVNKTTHQHFAIDKDSVAVEISVSRKEFNVLMSDSSKVALNLGKLINKLIETGEMNQYDLKPDLLSLQEQNSNYRIKLIISSIGGNFKPDDNGNQLNYLQGRLLIGKVK